MAAHPNVSVEAMLSEGMVDLVEEGLTWRCVSLSGRSAVGSPSRSAAAVSAAGTRHLRALPEPAKVLPKVRLLIDYLVQSFSDRPCPD
jgi:hypothetical protein